MAEKSDATAWRAIAAGLATTLHTSASRNNGRNHLLSTVHASTYASDAVGTLSMGSMPLVLARSGPHRHSRATASPRRVRCSRAAAPPHRGACPAAAYATRSGWGETGELQRVGVG